MKRLVSAIVIAVMLCGSCPLALAGSAYGVSPEEVTGIKLEQSVSVAVGNEYTLTWYVLANDESDDISVTFSSTDESIVTVNDEGTLRGIAPGDAVVTATTVEGGFTADCAVKVTGNGSITPTVDHNMYVFDYGGDFFRFQQRTQRTVSF